MTAAAYTGPAKQPRPASSRPASKNLLWKKGRSNFLPKVKDHLHNALIFFQHSCYNFYAMMGLTLRGNKK